MAEVPMVPCVSVVTVGSRLCGAAAVNHPSHRFTRGCIPGRELRSAPFALLRYPMLLQPVDL